MLNATADISCPRNRKGCIRNPSRHYGTRVQWAVQWAEYRLPTHANAPVSKGPPCERIISQAVSDYMLDIFLRRDNLKISIIGLGSVGKAAELGLAEFHEVSGYDIDGRGNWQDVLSYLN